MLHIVSNSNITRRAQSTFFSQTALFLRGFRTNSSLLTTSAQRLKRFRICYLFLYRRTQSTNFLHLCASLDKINFPPRLAIFLIRSSPGYGVFRLSARYRTRCLSQMERRIAQDLRSHGTRILCTGHCFHQKIFRPH